MIKRGILKILHWRGYKLVKIKKRPGVGELPPDLDQDGEFKEIFTKCYPYTMTSPERIYALYQAVQYVVRNKIAGDFIECGVWKGGSAMVMAYALLKLGDTSRQIYLYDTYEGMPPPSNKDMNYKGKAARDLLEKQDKYCKNSIWCYSSLEEVKQNLSRTHYPEDKLVFIQGKVEDTIPQTTPSEIAILRLDTDWYESTKHELIHLYPLLTKGGVLIVDDYGHWAGAKKAVDEYFRGSKYLARIDYTGRIVIKES